MQQVDPVATLTSIILSETRAFGPSPRTGGVIHQINDGTAKQIAELIVKHAPEYGLAPSLIAAGLCGESRFDPTALNPNWQDRTKPQETEFEEFMHTDIGLCQFDGATLFDDPEFKGATLAQVRAKAYDPNWSVPAFCAFVAKLVTDTKAEVAAEQTLLDNVPNHDIMVLTTEAYNAGLHGAAHHAHAKGDFSYGQRWVANAAKYEALLKG